MIKSITSILLIAAMLLSLPGVVMAESNNAILYSETFENYAENETAPSTIKIVSGLDSRIIDENGNKAFYGRALGETVNFSYAVPVSTSAETVMSIKTKIKGEKTDGKLFTASFSGTKTSFINLDEDGTIRLYDNTVIGGISSTYTTITIVARWKKNVFSVYVDKKCVAANWPMPTASATKCPTQIEFAIAYNGKGETEFFADDIRVYEGDKLPWEIAFPIQTENSEVLPFTATTDFMAESVNIIKDFDYDTSGTGLSVGNLGSELSKTTFDEGKKVLRWYSSEEQETKGYGDIGISEMATKSRYVFDFKMFINKLTGTSKLGLIDSRDTSGAWTVRGFEIRTSGVIKPNAGGGSVKIPFGKWVRVSFMYDLKKR